MIKQCSWCKRYEAFGEWVRVTNGVMGPITHGICPSCSTFPALEYAADRWVEEQR